MRRNCLLKHVPEGKIKGTTCICKGRGEEGEEVSSHWMLKCNNMLNTTGCPLLKKKATGLLSRKEKVMEFERESTRLPPLEKSLWKTEEAN